MIILLPDGRLCICYDAQPLEAQCRKIVLHLVDENHEHLKDDGGKDRILIRTVDAWTQECKTIKCVGYVD